MAFDPAALGDELIDAGRKQVSTGGRLKDAAVQLRDFGGALAPGEQIQDSMISVRAGATAIRSLLAPVVNALQVIRNALNGISVPTINPLFTTIDFPVIGRVRFVIGISTGSTFPLTGAAARVEIVRSNIAKVRDALKTIADGLNDLRKELPNVRKNLVDAATEMESGGADLIDAGKALQAAGKGLGGG
jgi:hypothetical protein